jgi:hypothetical protein
VFSSKSALAIRNGTTNWHLGISGSNPLAPTISVGATYPLPCAWLSRSTLLARDATALPPIRGSPDDYCLLALAARPQADFVSRMVTARTGQLHNVRCAHLSAYPATLSTRLVGVREEHMARASFPASNRAPGALRVSLYRLSGSAALAVGLVFAVGLAGVLGAILRSGYPDGWSLPLQDNWLAVIYKLLAGFGGNQAGQLHVVNPLDIVMLALAGLVMVGLFAALTEVNRLWPFLAMISPFAGIALFIATASIGRTGVICSVLIISIVMLLTTSFGKPVAITGVLAGVFLAIGDLASATGPSPLMAGLFGLGYVLVTVWFFLVAVSLLRLPRDEASGIGG